MKILAPAGVVSLALFLTGCHWLDEAENTAALICQREATLHAVYMAVLAPSRPADKVANAVRFHERTQALCIAGASIIEIARAHQAAADARQ